MLNARKTYERTGLKLHTFVTLAPEGGKWLVSRLGWVIPVEITRLHSHSRRRGEENERSLTAAGNGTTVPVLSSQEPNRYTSSKPHGKSCDCKTCFGFFRRVPVLSPLPPPCPVLGFYCINTGQTPSIHRRVR